jgi:hypothetical protein
MAYGKGLAKYIASTATAGTNNSYYYNRNTRYFKNRNYANGRIDVQAMFQDRFNFKGKESYIRLNWQTLQLVNRIVSGLVGRFMGRDEKIQVTATDTLSTNEKRDEYNHLEFVIDNKDKLQQLQDASGVQIMPKGDNIPQDKQELDLWQNQFQRLPEEILFELGINDVLTSNGIFDVLKEKMLHDSLEVGFIGTYTWMDTKGVIHVEWVKPENAVYSYTEYPDFRDTTWRGQIKSIKISELRRKYGVEFGGTLTEEQLFQIASTAKEFTLPDKLTWNAIWVNTFMRPYDEYNVRALDFELKTVDSENYTLTETKKNKSTIIQKGRPPKVKDNQKVIEDTNWNIYHGVYLIDNNIMCEWGLKDNMIRPQDPKEIGNAEFSYSFYQYQSYDMRNLAIPEKIEAAVDGMILALLKIQQIVSRMRPTGAAINVEALQNIDYGLGDKNKDVDHKQLYDQTGDIYYRGHDAEGNPMPIPITELKNSGFLEQMEGMIKDYQFWYQTLKDELGEDPNLITAAVQPRVTSENVIASERGSQYATDYAYRAYLYVMEDTAKKVSCLLYDSVLFGSNAYRKLVKEDVIKDRMFSTKFIMLPTAQEIAMLDARMNQLVQANPEAVKFIDTFKILRIAKEDVKLAEAYYQLCMKKMLQTQQQETQQNQQATFQSQQQSAIQKGQQDSQNLQAEMQMKAQIEMASAKEKQKEIVLSGIFQIYAKGLQIPSELKQLETEMIQNIALPLFAENMGNVNAIAQAGQQQQEQQEGEQPQQQAQEGQQGEQQEQQMQQPQPTQQQQIQQP